MLSFLMALVLTITMVMPVAAQETTTAVSIQLTKTTGTVTVSKGSGRNLSLRENMRLYNGYHVTTGEKSYSWINLDDTKLIKEDTVSEVEIGQNGKMLEVKVLSGGVFFDVSEDLKDDETLNISTSTMVVGIRGTRGWVRVTDRWTTEVCLLEGRAQCVVTDPVTNQLKTVVLHGGDVAKCVVYPQERIGDKCDILMNKQTTDTIPGFVLTELVRDIPMCDEIKADSGQDILRDLAQAAGEEGNGRTEDGSSATPAVIQQAEDRREKDEAEKTQKLTDIKKKLDKQENNVSQSAACPVHLHPHDISNSVPI